MKTVLFYGPFNSRSRDTETLMLAMKKDGFKVIFLSQYEGKGIIEFLRSNAIESESSGIRDNSRNLFYLLKQVFYLIRFCRLKKVDVIFSHLEPGNFVAVIAGYFIKAKLFVCRHHSNLYFLMKRDKNLSYRFTYRNAKRIIVLSQSTKQHMVESERILEKKIIVIPLAYDFSLYKKPDLLNVEKIRKEYQSDVLLITVGRLDEFKRAWLSISLLKNLLENGINAKLIIAGAGALLPDLDHQVEKDLLSDRVFFTGYVTNILDYLKASDFVLHPSNSEASCVVIKEAGLVKKPVIVCAGVGDFEDFIVSNENGFIVSKDSFVREALDIILDNHSNTNKLIEMGEKLEYSVLERFSIDKIYPLYKQLLKA